MHLSDRMWLIDCAVTVDEINKCKRKIKDLKTLKKNDSQLIDRLKGEYLPKIEKMSNDTTFFEYMLRKYTEDTKLFKLCGICDYKVYFSLLDWYYYFFNSKSNILLHPFVFLSNPSDFKTTEDYDMLLEWYQSYLDDPRETVNDMTNQLYDEHIEDTKEKIANYEDEIRKLEKRLEPCNEFLKDRKFIKSNWFNKHFRSKQLDIQHEYELLNRDISVRQNCIEQLNATIENKKETVKGIRNKVKKEFSSKLVKFNNVIVLMDMYREIQSRLQEDTELDSPNYELSNDYYYYFEYYLNLYIVDHLEKNLYILLSRNLNIDDIIEDYKNDKDSDIHVELNLQEILDYHQKVSNRRIKNSLL